jgi:hypothetical protein
MYTLLLKRVGGRRTKRKGGVYTKLRVEIAHMAEMVTEGFTYAHLYQPHNLLKDYFTTAPAGVCPVARVRVGHFGLFIGTARFSLKYLWAQLNGSA